MPLNLTKTEKIGAIAGLTGTIIKVGVDRKKELTVLERFDPKGIIIVALDGSGDYDTLQDGINALGSSGGTVQIKEGTYLISSKLSILKSNIIIQGMGKATLLQAEAALGNNTMLEFGDGGATTYENIEIKDLRIDGNPDASYCIYVKKCKRVFIHDCEISTATNAIVFFDANTILSRVNQNLLDSGIVEIDGNNNIISNNHGITNFLIQIDGDRNVITGNICDHNPDNAGSDRIAGSYNIWMGNITLNTGDDGVGINGDNNCIVGNISTGNPDNSLITQIGADENAFVGNILRDGISDNGANNINSGNNIA